MAHRQQPRRGNGQYQPATLGNTFGLGNEVCEMCGQMHPYKLGVEKPPAKCVSCGEVLSWKISERKQIQSLRESPRLFRA